VKLVAMPAGSDQIFDIFVLGLILRYPFDEVLSIFILATSRLAVTVCYSVVLLEGEVNRSEEMIVQAGKGRAD